MNLIHSCDIPGSYIDGLERIFPGIRRIAIPRARDIYASIASHPDIFLFRPDPGTLIYSPSLPPGIVEAIRSTGVRLVPSYSTPEGEYPKTAVLNAVRIGDRVLHKADITDRSIKDFAAGNGLQAVNIPQGYASCSIVPVGNDAIITPDNGIAGAVSGSGLDVLLIFPGYVELPGEKYGFIGGAKGVLDDGTIIFLGDIRLHPDHGAITGFLTKYGIAHKYIPGLPLFDAGGLFFI